jgi:hypothetical protein
MTNPHYPAFIYVDSDIPAGMTIREWRWSRAPRFQRSFWDRLFRLPGRRVDLV